LALVEDKVSMVARLVASERSPSIPGDALIEHLDDAIAVLSSSGAVLRANGAFGRLLGSSPPEFMGRSVIEIGHGALSDPHIAEGLVRAQAHLATTETIELECDLPRDGLRTLRISMKAISGLESSPLIIVVLHDSTVERQADSSHRLHAIELTHRVKNSLQVVGSFVGRQARRAMPAEREGFLAIQRRIAAIAALYEVLTRSIGTDRVQAADLLSAVAKGLRAALLDENLAVQIEVRAAAVQLDARDAEFIGLLVNELATNAVKHGFPNGGGHVIVALRPSEGGLTLSVSDDGVGIDDGESAGQGSAIVASLVAALHGTLLIRSGPDGASFEVSFPHRPARRLPPHPTQER
jgi:PAS domain S-box-containing protein